LFEKHDRIGQGNCHSQLGAVAIERFREARAARRAEAELLAALNTALAEYHQALELLPDTAVNDLAVTHNALGAIYDSAGDIDRALPHYRQSIRLLESAGDIYRVGVSRFNVALALLHSGKLSDAREYARAALKNFEPYGPGAADVTAQTLQLLAQIEQALAAGS
jgi:tetratricopeptide (TPR) repeat protein